MTRPTEHTPGPWVVDSCPDANGFLTIRRADGSEHGDTDQQPIATVYREPDAARIVACVNACEGVSTAALIANTGGTSLVHNLDAALRAERDTLAARNAELREALQALVDVAEVTTMVGMFGYPEGADGPLPRARALLARLDGGK